MSHVFISYSKKNRAYARTLADNLLSMGFDVWIDDRIDFGEMWERTIFKAIDECSAFIVIMTPDSYESDWVLREIQYADRRHKPQFPVLLEGEDFPRYGPHQHVDVRGGILPPEHFYERLEKVAPRRIKVGTNVTPQDVAVPQTDTLPAPPAASIVPPTRNLNTPVIAAIAVGIFALLIVGLVLLNRPSKTDEQVQTLVVETATLRQEITQLSKVLTPEATQQIASVPSLTITQTSTQPPSKTPTQTLTATAQGGGDGRIVFSSNLAGNYEIYSMNINGSGLRRLTTTTGDDRDPSWSPDGSQIVFTSNRDGNYEIYAMNANGSSLRRLTTTTGDDRDPSWSPDGSQIVFSSNLVGNYEIYIMHSDGTSLRRWTTTTGDDRDPSWSPNGSQIVFSSNLVGNYEIYVMNASRNGSPQRLTTMTGDDRNPSWSPDGSQIIFSSNFVGNYEIYAMHSDGTNLRRWTNNAAVDYFPAWSPDGSQITFTSNREGNSEIYVMNANRNSTPQKISANGIDNVHPQWQPTTLNNPT